MTTLETFRVVAAGAAAVATFGVLFAGRSGAAPARLASLGMLAGSWLLLLGSLVPRADANKITHHLAPLGIAIAIALILTLVAVLVVLRFPVVWLIALAIALPIRLPLSIGSQSANLLIPLYGVIVVGLLAAIVRAAQGRLPAPPRSWLISLPLAAFVGFTLASLAWTGDWGEGTAKLAFFYIPFMMLYALVLIWWNLVGSPLRPVAATTVAVGLIGAVLALYQFATKTVWWNATLETGNNYNRLFRANGIFFDPNMLGRYLAAAVIAALAYLLVIDDRTQIALVAIAIVILGAGFVVTFSRSSALMLLVGLFVVSLRAFTVKRTLAVTLALLVLVGGPSLAFSQSVRDKVTSVTGIASASEGRAKLAKGGIELWKSEPIHGVGIGAFAKEYKAALPPETRRRTRVVVSHTAPITVLAELGSVGMGLFALLCLGAVIAIGRGIRKRPQHSLALAVILALLIGILIHSVLYAAFFEDPMMWFLLAAGAALAAPATGAPLPAEPRPMVAPATTTV